MAVAWSPGQPVSDAVPLLPLCACLGMGQADIDSYDAIAEKLVSRKCESVGELKNWQLAELLSLCRTL